MSWKRVFQLWHELTENMELSSETGTQDGGRAKQQGSHQSGNVGKTSENVAK
jgi:hypothetical protein